MVTIACFMYLSNPGKGQIFIAIVLLDRSHLIAFFFEIRCGKPYVTAVLRELQKRYFMGCYSLL